MGFCTPRDSRFLSTKGVASRGLVIRWYLALLPVCVRKHLANRMEFPDNRFPVDLCGCLRRSAASFGNEWPRQVASQPSSRPLALLLHDDLRRNAEARRRFTEGAVNAGFEREGIFKGPLRLWIIERLRERRLARSVRLGGSTAHMSAHRSVTGGVQPVDAASVWSELALLWRRRHEAIWIRVQTCW